MLKDFFAAVSRFAESEGGEDLFTRILSCRLRKGELITAVQVSSGAGRSRAWKITTIGNCGAMMTPGLVAEAPALLDEHCTIVPFAEDTCDLYISDAPASTDVLMLRLIEAHESRFHTWFPYQSFLRLEVLEPDAHRCCYGKLASGPRSLLAAFAQVLQEFDVPCSMAGGYRPLTAFGNPCPCQLNALVIGDRWMVAESFDTKPT